MAAEEDDFERPLRELEKKIEELSGVPGGEDRADEIERLDRRLQALRQEVYARLTPWQRALVARHPKRPTLLTTSISCSRISSRSTAIGSTPTIRPSWPDSRPTRASRSRSSD